MSGAQLERLAELHDHLGLVRGAPGRQEALHPDLRGRRLGADDAGDEGPVPGVRVDVVRVDGLGVPVHARQPRRRRVRGGGGPPPGVHHGDEHLGPGAQVAGDAGVRRGGRARLLRLDRRAQPARAGDEHDVVGCGLADAELAIHPRQDVRDRRVVVGGDPQDGESPLALGPLVVEALGTDELGHVAPVLVASQDESRAVQVLDLAAVLGPDRGRVLGAAHGLDEVGDLLAQDGLLQALPLLDVLGLGLALGLARAGAARCGCRTIHGVSPHMGLDGR